MKKTLSYSKRVKLEYTLLGAIYLISGMLSFVGGVVHMVISMVGCAACFYTIVRVLFTKTEKADEMAEENINRAKSRTMDYMLLVYCLMAFAAVILVEHVDISVSMISLILNITFIILGMNKLIIGLLFKKYEEA